MPSATAISGMLKTDTLRMLRDRFLLGFTAYILCVVLLMRWAIPWLKSEILARSQFDLTPYQPLLVSYFVVQLAPLIVGIIGGFLLLESREDRTVKALLVSPTPLSSYIFIACVLMFAAGILVAVAFGAMIGIGLPAWPALFIVCVAAAPAAPMFALLVSSIANDKVQAFAYLKLFGLGPLLATGAYFLPEKWQWLASIYPPYCAAKAYWVAEAGGSHWPLWVFLALITFAIWVGILQRVFLYAARR